MKIVQLVPALTPARDGIGDYAVLLAEGLAPKGIETTFLTYEQGGEPGIVSRSASSPGEPETTSRRASSG